MIHTTGIALTAREILDSRSVPTLEVTLTFGPYTGTASVPSGKSRGSREVYELRDADGVGVQAALDVARGDVAQLLATLPLDPMRIDTELKHLDGTAQYARIGGNVSLAVSYASRRLAAAAMGIPLWRYIASESGAPQPSLPALYMNVINGGAHAQGSRVPFQEHLVIDTDTPQRAYQRLSGLFKALGATLSKERVTYTFGDEGGYVSDYFTDERQTIAFLREQYKAYPTCTLGLDVAATNFYDAAHSAYRMGDALLSPEELLAELAALGDAGVVSFEDPFEEDDTEHAHALLSRLNGKAQVVADDMAVTQKQEVERLIASHAANALIVKPNQVGTLKEAYESVSLAREHGWQIIASHRSGETLDSFIADFAVGIGAHGLKAGAPSQAVRRAKYERLCAIETEMGDVA